MGGIKQISGVWFKSRPGAWIGEVGDLTFSLNPDPDTKCLLTDTRDWSSYPFHTVHAAKVFARRRQHGRTFEEHERAELLNSVKEQLRLNVKEIAKRLHVSPRTVEAWSSGVRVVPVGVHNELLMGY